MASVKKFGTFGGVFTPSILTILGVIMYLRLPSIVGQSGLWTTIGIIVVAHVISFATGLSVASIATDKKVQAGGTYYMLSRSIGLPIGGTLGLALFVGLSFSVSLYVIGFSESFLAYWGWDVSKNMIRIAGSITLVSVTAVTLISTALALKAQFFIMAAIVLSLVSIVFGNHDLGPVESVATSIPTAVPFIVLFGIFFPAVTGFEAGVSMSGDLKDPKKSIPSGTIWAIVVGFAVYLAMAAFFYYTVSPDQLVNNPNVLLDISLFGPLVIAGIWGATISSALGSILGAPRILQATAVDRVVHRFFAKGYGKENEPRNALILTFIIAEAGILIGELDVIARIVSMFFITTYGFLNLSCFIESWASPDFRPDFKIPKVVSLIGTTACFVVMIQLDFVAMIGATVLLGAVFLYLKRKELTLESGDTWEGFWSSLLRSGLQRLSQSDVHERNWRPNVLLYSFGTHAREPMMEFGSWLVHKRGLLSNFDLVVNPQSSRLLPRSTQAVEDEGEVEVGIFSRRLVCPDPFEAMESIATYYGFSGVEPNAVIMGWAGNSKHPKRFVELIQRFHQLDLNVLLVNIDESRGFGEHKSIDVWWRGEDNNISLTLALVRFLTGSDSWAGASIRFLVVNSGDTAYSEAIQNRMDGILESFRIDAKTVVINNVVGRKPVRDIIGLESAHTDLTIIGIPVITAQSTDSYIEDTSALLDRLPTVLLVSASSFFNELTVGIETSTKLLLDRDVEPAKADELPELTLPLDEKLRWAFTNVDTGIQDIAAELASQSLTAVSDMHLKAATEIRDQVLRAFSAVHRVVEKEDRPRARKSSQRVQSALAFQTRDIISSFVQEQLPLQHKVLETAILKSRSKIRNVERQAPEELTQSVSSTDESGNDSDSSSVFGKLFGQQRLQKIAFRERVMVRVNSDLQHAILKSVEQSASSSTALLENVLVQFRNAVDALQRIAGDVNAGTASVDAIDVEQLRIEDEFENVLDEFTNQQQSFRTTLQVQSREIVQAMSDDVESLARGPSRDKGEQDRLSAELLEAPVRWEENQRLVLNRVLLGVQLVSFQQRLQTIVLRHRDEIGLTLQNRLRKPLRDIEEGVTAALKAPDSESGARIRAADVVAAGFDPSKWSEAFATDIRTAIEEMPESIQTLPEHAVQTMVDHPLDEAEVITVSLRRVIDYIVKIELIGPVQEELARWTARAQKSRAASQDVLRLVNYQSDETQIDSTLAEEVVLHDATSTEAPVAHDTILVKGLQRLNSLIEGIEADANASSELITDKLDVALQRLNTYTIAQSEGELQRYVRDEKGRQLQSRFASLRDGAVGFARDRVVQLLYRRSEGVLLARQLQEADPYLGSAALRGLSLIEHVSPSDELLRQIPMYYRQLFLDLPNITEEFWVGADNQLGRASQAVERWRRGQRGGLLVVGEAHSGKTAFSQRVTQTHFKREQISRLSPPREGSVDPDLFEKRLRDTLGVVGAMESWAGQLPPETAIIVDDLEKWWERSLDGSAVLARFERVIELLGDRCLFVVNANVHALKLIDRIHPFTGIFLDVISRSPSNAEQIKEIVMLRHRSAGLPFVLDDHPESEISDWRMARLFTELFDYSRGNVGTALQGWIKGIKSVTAKGLVIRSLDPPDLSVLETATPLQNAILINILLHSGLTHERLQRISEVEDALLRHEIQLLLRLGWVRERDNVLVIDRFLRPHLSQSLVERRLV